MLSEKEKTVAENDGSTPWTKAVFSKDDFWANSAGLHYSYLVDRTLHGAYAHTFQPDYVFYVGKSPAAYIKTVDCFCEPDIRKWQRFLWNQTVVPMLILQSPTNIRVYTANTAPQAIDTEDRLHEILETTVNALESIKDQIEEGEFYENHSSAFQRTTTVDKYLLANLNATALELTGMLEGDSAASNLAFVHRFLTRILFVCYLIERDMVKGTFFTDSPLSKLRPSSDKQPYLLRDLLNDLTTVKDRHAAICQLFSYVKERFNGSLFHDCILQESIRDNKAFFDTLVDFLNGHDLKSGQMSLGFWAYDFNVIPIETISSIYETFLKAQGELNEELGATDSQRGAGAYDTPPHLAELAVDIAVDGLEKPIHKLKVLDPSCGSGVFLVTMLGRMVNSLRRKLDYKGKRPSEKWGEKIMELLLQLYGVDVNPTACHITCFSLYLAALEQMTPLDLEMLHQAGNRFPPLLLDKEDGYIDGNNIIHANFFDEDISLGASSFDLVIGNPPWVSREHATDAKFLEWRSSLGKQKENVLAPEKQMAAGFMWKVPQYLSDSGKACLLLPSAMLLNSNTNQFQKEWLESVELERVVNFSDLSFVLFEGADRPCIAACFRQPENKMDSERKIRYESPKFDIRSQVGGSVYIREEDTVQLPARKIIEAAKEGHAPMIWELRFWGSWRDQRLVERLDTLPKLNELAGKPKENKLWIKGEGCQPYSENDRKKKKTIHVPWWDENYKFLQLGENINLVIASSCFSKIPEEFRELRRSPDPRIFDLPKVVVSHGSKNMKVAFCEAPAIFRHSLESISAPPADADMLRFLSIVIKSDVVQYYLFHTSGNWGTERDTVHFHELLALPFFFPKDAPAPANAEVIVKRVAQRVKDVERKQTIISENEAETIRRELEPLIREYYGITPAESILIDDTLQVIIPSSTPSAATAQDKIPTLRRISNQDAIIYAKTLCATLSSLSGTGSFAAKIFYSHPYSIVKIDAGKTTQGIEIVKDCSRIKKLMARLQKVLEKQHGNVTFCQNLKAFDEDSLYILKPTRYRFWMKSAALNDADEIAGAILVSREERRS